MMDTFISHRRNLFAVVFIFSIVFASHQKLVAAMRPLQGEQWLQKEGRLVFQTLQRGPVTPSGPNPCTNIPGQGSGICTLNDMNVAGRVVHAPPPPAFPDVVVEVGVAETGTEADQQDQSS